MKKKFEEVRKMKKWKQYLPALFYIATLAMMVLSSGAIKKWW
jgi:hypothetical protein